MKHQHNTDHDANGNQPRSEGVDPVAVSDSNRSDKDYSKHDSIIASVEAESTSNQMSSRKRFFFMALIMVLACTMVMIVLTVILYRYEIQKYRELLHVSARSQARLIEAVGRYDQNKARVLQDVDPTHDPSAATLSQVIDAHERYRGFGQTGEFTLARREGNSIVFVLRHRNDALDRPSPIDFDSDLAEPMRLALKGLSGTIIGLDYRGQTVLAAYEPVGVLNLGIVAKIDLEEIRAPYSRSCLSAAVVSLLFVLIGTMLCYRIGNPIIEQLEAKTEDLKSEIILRRKSEERFRTIFENAPVLIDAFDENGRCVLWNNQCQKTFGWTIDEISAHSNPLMLFYPDQSVFKQVLKSVTNDPDGQFREWHPVTKQGKKLTTIWASFGLPDGTKFNLGHDITERMQAEQELDKYHKQLEELVLERTAQLNMRVTEVEELNRAMLNVMEDLRASNKNLEITGRALTDTNKELESFCYSVSHDLRAPLRALDGFSQILIEDCSDKLDIQAREYLNRIRSASQRMGHLIDDLLSLSRLTQQEIIVKQVCLSNLAKRILLNIQQMEPERKVEYIIEEDLEVDGDEILLRTMLENLLENAWKFTAKTIDARIEFGSRQINKETVFFVSDNGAGFEMQYAKKMFDAFQRLHTVEEFPGTGIGLATVQRVVHRHGGRIWAEGEVNQGATFYFIL